MLTRFRDAAHRVTRRPALLAGLLLALFLVTAAIGAPWLAPHPPEKQHRDGLTAVGAPAPPGRHFRLGADSRGRDVFSRLLHGARLSLGIGLGATAIAIGLGLTVGVCAGYFGGWTETLLMRSTDVVLAFPSILLAVAMAAVTPRRSAFGMALIIGLLGWAAPARVFRGETLSLRERSYVEAALSMGAGKLRILLRHVVPHLGPSALVMASLGAASAILLDAGLSFLGIGVPAPAPTWGSMLEEARTWYSLAPWLAFWPGLLVVLTVAAFNLVAYDLQRTLRGERTG